VSTRFDDVSVEERLRDATHAFADAIEPAPDAWARLRTAIDEPRARPLPWRRGVVVIAVAAAAAALIVATVILVRTTSDDGGTVLTPAGPAPSAPVPAPSPPAPTPLGAPEVQGPDAASTLLTSWSAFHVGYSYVYADGRVIWQTDATYRAGDPYARTRRLSPAGLDLVYSGELTADDFVGGYVPSHAWADPYDEGWTASEHAACLWQESENQYDNDEGMFATGPFRDAMNHLGELPAAAQALLSGPRRTFPGDGFQSDCFILTPPEARAALDLNGPNPWGLNEGPGFVHLIPPDAGPDEGAIDLVIHALLPHGTMLFWGG
jgi:hypothetical protein